MNEDMKSVRGAAMRNALVRAGRGERASSARRAKVLAIGAGVAVGAAVTTTSTAAAATAASSSMPAAAAAGGSFAGWKMVVVAAGLLAASGVAAVAVAVVERAPANPPPVERTRMVSPPGSTSTTTTISDRSANRPAEVPTMSVGDLPSAKNEPAAHVARAASSTTSNANASVNAEPAPETAAPASLADEMRSAEAIRAAAREGRTADALRLLDEHDGRFPNGALAEEALVLRIEALAKAGRASDAKPLAERFVSERPKSPYAPRVRATLSRLE